MNVILEVCHCKTKF